MGNGFCEMVAILPWERWVNTDQKKPSFASRSSHYGWTHDPAIMQHVGSKQLRTLTVIRELQVQFIDALY